MKSENKSANKIELYSDMDLIPKPVLRTILPLLVCIMLIVVASAGYLIINQHKTLLEYQIHQMSDRISDAIFSDLIDLAKGMRQTLIPISMDNRVIESLETADKERLLSEWGAVFEELAVDEALNHFTFMDKNRFRLLRVHNPAMSDGIINRYTTLEAELTGNVSWGIELEMGSLEIPTLRVVKPVFKGEDIVGYIELGADIEKILWHIHERTNSHLVLAVNKQFINRQRWEETMTALQREHNWSRLPNSVFTFSTAENIPDGLISLISEMDMETVYKGFRYRSNGTSLFVSAIELKNAEGMVFGNLFYSVEITPQVLSYKNTIYTGIFISGLMIAFMILISIFFVRKTDSVISNQYERLKQSEIKFKSLVNNSPDSIIMVNNERIITFLNKEFFGNRPEDYIGKDCMEIFHPSYHSKVKILLETVFDQKQLLSIEHIYNEKYFESRFVPLFTVDHVNSIIIITTDLTERKRSELLIKEQAEQFEEILNTSVNGFFIVNLEGKITHANRALSEMTGYTRDEMLGLSVKDIEVLDSEEEIASRINKVLETGAASFESEHRRKDGTTYKVRLNIAFSRSKNELIGFVTDITQEKEAELLINQSNLRFMLAEEAANLGVWDWDIINDRVFWSDKLKNIFGYELLEDYSDSAFFIQYIHQEDVADIKNKIQSILENNTPWNTDFRIVRNDNKTIWLRSMGKLFLNDSGFPERMTGVVVDITERKQQELMLSSSLKEKEILLKEVHHRVKNNLQIISSMLYLQSLHLDDEAVSDMFKISLNRVKSMALVHEFLYQTDNFNHIDFKKYVSELISVINESYQNYLVPIDIKLNVRTNINFEQVIYCGLIINELINNAFKYAFKDRTHGEIVLSVYKNKDYNFLTVTDNGIGIPDMTIIEQGNSLGVRIIKELTRQLKGTMTVNSVGGTSVEIKFPAL